MLASNRFWVGLLNYTRQILARPTPVAMAMKFETKGYHSDRIENNGVGLLNDVIQILSRPTPLPRQPKFRTKKPITILL